MSESHKSCSDEEFVRLFQDLGPTEMAKHLNTALRHVFTRRRSVEKQLGIILKAPNDNSFNSSFKTRVPYSIQKGIVIVTSDCHYYPGRVSVAHRGMIKLGEQFGDEVKMFIWNGDVADFPKISRHPPIGWNRKPNVKDELAVIEERSEEILETFGPKCQYAWNIGNHDARFENRLAASSPEYEGVKGFALPDHFPHWNMHMSLWINDDVAVKHRFKGGVHATHNNTLNAGKTIVTGHLHSLKVTPFTDYNGTRFGVDTGTLEDPYGAHTDYVEDNPLNHRSGFIVLTFHKGRLLWPEIARAFDENHIEFRGKLIAC
jgi:hypothetical protein